MRTTLRQRRAIQVLRQAFRECQEEGVAIFAMDDSVYASVVYDPAKDFHQQYQEASGGDSSLTDIVVVGGAFKGSGGW
jgi:hypothetical protein